MKKKVLALVVGVIAIGTVGVLTLLLLPSPPPPPPPPKPQVQPPPPPQPQPQKSEESAKEERVKVGEIDKLFREYAKTREEGKGKSERPPFSLPPLPPLNASPPQVVPPQVVVEKKEEEKLVEVVIYGITCREGRCVASTSVGTLKEGDTIGKEKVVKVSEVGVQTDRRLIKW